MARFHITPEGNIPFTDEEEAIWDAKEAAASAEKSRTAYIDNRQREYPPITDYIDGIVKGNQSQVQAYIDACLAVKAKYPKPN
jgi:hypothetical protein